MLGRAKSIKVNRRVIASCLIIAVVFGIVGALMYYVVIEPDKQYEYYRGIYDACVQFTEDIVGCNDAVDTTFKYDWYSQPSPSFDGPNLPVEESPRAE